MCANVHIIKTYNLDAVILLQLLLLLLYSFRSLFRTENGLKSEREEEPQIKTN